jgi:mannan endo-1,4-beta-mannosidase
MKIIYYFLFLFTVNITYSQISVNYNINTEQNIHPISPYIYGVNNSTYSFARAIRKGGNRLTGYNWENNASSAGTDWHNSSDNYLPATMGISQAEKDSAGLVLSRFVEKANTLNQYTVVTLPMADYVAADKNGEVPENETAPSV